MKNKAARAYPATRNAVMDDWCLDFDVDLFFSGRRPRGSASGSFVALSNWPAATYF